MAYFHMILYLKGYVILNKTRIAIENSLSDNISIAYRFLAVASTPDRSNHIFLNRVLFKKKLKSNKR